MNPKMLKNFHPENPETKPIIEIDEKRIMPLYMFIGTVEFILQGSSIGNLMITILHQKKTNTLEIRGRMRYEDTGRKTEFKIPGEYKLENLEIAKKEIKNFYEKMLIDLALIETEPIFELEFKVNEKIDDLIQKINDSNKFNIGTAKKP